MLNIIENFKNFVAHAHAVDAAIKNVDQEPVYDINEVIDLSGGGCAQVYIDDDMVVAQGYTADAPVAYYFRDNEYENVYHVFISEATAKSEHRDVVVKQFVAHFCEGHDIRPDGKYSLKEEIEADGTTCYLMNNDVNAVLNMLKALRASYDRFGIFAYFARKRIDKRIAAMENFQPYYESDAQ